MASRKRTAARSRTRTGQFKRAGGKPRKRPRRVAAGTYRRKRSAIRVTPVKRRRRRNNPGDMKLSFASLKKIFTPIALLAGVAGAIGTRAAYGIIRQQAPTLDAKLTALLATAAVGAAAILGTRKQAIAGPAAVGALTILVIDLLGPDIADLLADHWPQVATPIAVGMGTEPPALVPDPEVEWTEMSGYPMIAAGRSRVPDAYGLAQPLGRHPDAYGLGQVDAVSLVPYM